MGVARSAANQGEVESLAWGHAQSSLAPAGLLERCPCDAMLPCHAMPCVPTAAPPVVTELSWEPPPHLWRQAGQLVPKDVRLKLAQKSAQVGRGLPAREHLRHQRLWLPQQQAGADADLRQPLGCCGGRLRRGLLPWCMLLLLLLLLRARPAPCCLHWLQAESTQSGPGGSRQGGQLRVQ